MSPGGDTRDGHVFLSYARDAGVGAAWAARIRARLEQAGVAVWQDQAGIAPGHSLSAEVAEAIERASALICVLSVSAAGRPWMEAEVNYALGPGRGDRVPVIPVPVEEGVVLRPPLTAFAPLEFRGGADDPWDALVGRLRPHGTGARPAGEVAYLQALLYEQDLELHETHYVPLVADRREASALVRSGARRLMPQAFELLDRRFSRGEVPGGDEPQAAPGAPPVDDVLDLLLATRRLVVLGEPGAGKTFSLRRAAAHFARAALADPAAPLPVFVPLVDWLDPDEPLADFISRACLSGPLGWEALAGAERACLLLDGLNELPDAKRAAKAGAIRAVAEDRRLPLVVASCREHEFTGPLALDLDQARIRPLAPAQVRGFVCSYLGQEAGEALFWHLAGGDEVRDAWHAWERHDATFEQFWSVERMEHEVPDVHAKTSMEEDRAWRRARFDQRSLLRLVSSPFFLAAVVSVSARGGLAAIGTDQAQLLDALVEVRLADECGRYREREGCEHPGRDRVEAGLGAVAWAMQLREELPESGQLALAEDECSRLLGGEALALARDAGLLTRADPVRFSHQLFQEFFVARRLRAELDAGTLDARALWPEESWWAPRRWDQPALLAAQLAPEDPRSLVHALREAQPEVLSRCLDAPGVGGAGEATLAGLGERWTARLDPKREPRPEARHAVANALARLGLDRRRGVGLDAGGVPDIEWQEVPGGPSVWQDGERREVAGFWMARYPVTNAQYAAFVAAGGYGEERWWAGLGKRAEAPEPSRWAAPNRPRETVSWYEATAYCRWLSEALGYVVWLPTEVEWEKAARGESGAVYPWGDEYRSGYANIDETYGKAGQHYLEETCAVGLYPQGASAYRVEDLSGNVWEWCANLEKTPAERDDGGTGARGLRGGSWGLVTGLARADDRGAAHPVHRNVNIGFRVCCRSPHGSGDR